MKFYQRSLKNIYDGSLNHENILCTYSFKLKLRKYRE